MYAPCRWISAPSLLLRHGESSIMNHHFRQRFKCTNIDLLANPLVWIIRRWINKSHKVTDAVDIKVWENFSNECLNVQPFISLPVRSVITVEATMVKVEAVKVDICSLAKWHIHTQECKVKPLRPSSGRPRTLPPKQQGMYCQSIATASNGQFLYVRSAHFMCPWKSLEPRPLMKIVKATSP